MGPKPPSTPPAMACAPTPGPGAKTSMHPPKAQVRPTAPWRRADAKTPMTPAPGLKREKPMGPPVAKPAKVAKTEQAVENEVRECMQKRGFDTATLTPDQLRLAAQAWHSYREKFFHTDEGRWRPREGHIDGGRFGESVWWTAQALQCKIEGGKGERARRTQGLYERGGLRVLCQTERCQATRCDCQGEPGGEGQGEPAGEGQFIGFQFSVERWAVVSDLDVATARTSR